MDRFARITTTTILMSAVFMGCLDNEAALLPVGATCEIDSECISGAECHSTEHYCRCPAGLISCGDACVDLVTDARHCGYCGVTCADDVECVAGVCQSPSSPAASVGTTTQALTIDPVTNLFGGTPPPSQTTCNDELEATATLARNPSGGGEMMAAGLGFNLVSWTGATWSDWRTSYTSLPQVANLVVSGDAWSTYSRSLDRIFFSFNGKVNNQSCLAVAGTSPSFGWQYPATCAVPALQGSSDNDQGHIVYDDAAARLWAITNDGRFNAARVDVFSSCTTSPGYPGCSRTALLRIPTGGSGVNSPIQTAIEVNACTNNAVVAYRDPNQNIKLLFVRPDATIVNSGGFTILPANGETWAQGQKNPGCGKGTIRRCNQGTTDCSSGVPADECMRLEGGPEIDATSVTSTVCLPWVGCFQVRGCYAAVAVDNLRALDSDPTKKYAKSRLILVDITNESSPTVRNTYFVDSSANPINNYLSFPILSDYTRSLGWFYINDSAWGAPNPCNVGLEGWVAPDFLNPALTWTGRIGDSFPAIFMRMGLNDYQIGVKGGGVGGYLYPVWPMMVPSPNCPIWPCNGTNYNKAAKITRILP